MYPGAKCREDDNLFRKVDQGQVQGHEKGRTHIFGHNFLTERRRNVWNIANLNPHHLNISYLTLTLKTRRAPEVVSRSKLLNAPIFTNVF